MRALLPEVSESVDLVRAYEVPDGAGRDRPFVRANMISSIDGSITVGGRSGRLGGPADRNLFMLLRSLADVVLVGAGTARAERYGPARLSADHRARRVERGQAPVPVLAVVTASGQLDWASPFFTEAEVRPIVFTGSGGDERNRAEAEAVADVVPAGGSRVDPAQLVEHLARAGHRSVLLEGGPGLNSDIVRAGLLDELCLTLAPRLVGGTGSRVVAGRELAEPLELEVVHLLEEDGFLFYRLAVPPTGR